jgi:hypothetical protein
MSTLNVISAESDLDISYSIVYSHDSNKTTTFLTLTGVSANDTGRDVPVTLNFLLLSYSLSGPTITYNYATNSFPISLLNGIYSFPPQNLLTVSSLTKAATVLTMFPDAARYTLYVQVTAASTRNSYDTITFTVPGLPTFDLSTNGTNILITNANQPFVYSYSGSLTGSGYLDTIANISLSGLTSYNITVVAHGISGSTSKNISYVVSTTTTTKPTSITTTKPTSITTTKSTTKSTSITTSIPTTKSTSITTTNPTTIVLSDNPSPPIIPKVLVRKRFPNRYTGGNDSSSTTQRIKHNIIVASKVRTSKNTDGSTTALWKSAGTPVEADLPNTLVAAASVVD